MPTRDYEMVYQALQVSKSVERNLNQANSCLPYFDKATHSQADCNQLKKDVAELRKLRQQLTTSICTYGREYQRIELAQANQNNPEYSVGTCYDFSYKNDPPVPPRKSYARKTVEQLFGGDFTEEVTGLGILGTLGLSFTGLDAPMDIRDTIASIKKKDWPGAVINGMGLFPIIGVFGKTDDVYDGLKALNKAGDISSMGRKTKKFISKADDFLSAGKTVSKGLKKKYYAMLKENVAFPETLGKMDVSDWKRVSKAEKDAVRSQFTRTKKLNLIAEWEELHGMKWPTYAEDVYSKNGKLLRHAGDRYDAHHIRPLTFGGQNTVENLTPAHALNHYDKQGIHAPDSPYGLMEKLYQVPE